MPETGHAHEHHHYGHHHDPVKRLALSLLITLVVMLVEGAGGYFANSLALLSDAGHMFTDAFALGLSLIAARISKWSPDSRATFGYQRVGLLAAIINGGSLFVISFVIFSEAIRRFSVPPVINTRLMAGVAILGLVANTSMVSILSHGHKDLNIKSAWLHVVGDALSSFGVIVAAVIIMLTGWRYADPLASVLIGVIILVGGLRVVIEATHVFLELAPKGIDVEEVAREICDFPGVMGVHDVHLWAITKGQVMFTAHIWVSDEKISEVQGLSSRLKQKLASMGIDHVTLEFQCMECEDKGIYCELREETGGHPEHG
ncbi:MAG: cation diffusion facilitator family transporter [Nitrospiraceae bacterium]|nr:cation diffusion facilitator family transporter [Nitrospiraceae bacterium]